MKSIESSIVTNEILSNIIEASQNGHISEIIIHNEGLLLTEALNTEILDPLAYQTAIGPDFQLLYWEIAGGGKAGYIPKPLVNLFASRDSISVVLGKQLRPLYAHAMLRVASYFGLTVKKRDRRVLNHWIKEGVILNRVSNLEGTPGDFSFRIALSNWPLRGVKLLLRKLKFFLVSKK